MDAGKFGQFAQLMSDVGLVFDIEFTEDELVHPSWIVFDKKIEEGISILPGSLRLPPAHTKSSKSMNTTLWTLVNRTKRRERKPARSYYSLTGSLPTTMDDWTLDNIIRKFAMPNPISSLDGTPVCDDLIVIGMFLKFYSSSGSTPHPLKPLGSPGLL